MSSLIEQARSYKMPLRVKKAVADRCTCAAEGYYVHEAGCSQAGSIRRLDSEENSTNELVLPFGVPKPRKARRKLRKTPPVPAYMFKLQFNFTRPVSIPLWKRIEAPPGWRKCPSSHKGQMRYHGVRFQCNDFKFALTPDEIAALHMKLLLSLEL